MIAQKNQAFIPDIPKDLYNLKQLLFDKCGLECTSLAAEAESAEYSAYSFHLNSLFVRYRIAKITPTKTGQFVTLWKRIENGPIQPFDNSDDLDIVIIAIRNNMYVGQFVFPKSILLEKGIISGDKSKGKRAFRVYAPWDYINSKQAEKTQQWQSAYFIDLSTYKLIDLILFKKLFRNENYVK